MNQIRRAMMADVEAVRDLYDTLNDYLATHVNYTGWMKGVYPNAETALTGIQKEDLFVIYEEGHLAGTVILNHDQADAYEEGRWSEELNNEEVLVVHTLAIHPEYTGRGIATKLLEFAANYGKEQGIKAIRLDASIGNAPAQALYTKCGYKEAGIVNLRLGIPELVWFKLYELPLNKM